MTSSKTVNSHGNSLKEVYDTLIVYNGHHPLPLLIGYTVGQELFPMSSTSPKYYIHLYNNHVSVHIFTVAV